MPASRQAGARSPLYCLLLPTNARSFPDRAFVVFPNEAGQAAGTFPSLF